VAHVDVDRALVAEVGSSPSPTTLSSSSSRAVNMMIGTALPARRRRQTSRPSSFGSMMSRTTRSMSSLAKRASASSPSRACTTRNPSRSSGNVSSFWTESSSSTRRIVASGIGNGLRDLRH
jgi:hypothetical protein